LLNRGAKCVTTPWSLSSWDAASGERSWPRSPWNILSNEKSTGVIADLVGKGDHVRTVPVPNWVKAAVDNWLTAAGIRATPPSRAINKAGRIATSGFSPKVIWGVVKAGYSKCGLDGVAPHDLRRTCARLCHEAGGELEHIQFLLGHVGVQTTERYLGCKQRLRNAVKDKIGLEPAIA
jgi:integrase